MASEAFSGKWAGTRGLEGSGPFLRRCVSAWEFIMKCDRCGTALEAGESHEHNGQKLCDDCFLDASNPPQACDPWAVHLAKSDKGRSGVQLTPGQQKLYDLVKERGMISFPEAASRLGLTEEDVRREFATLRHLELLRGHKQRQQVFIALF